MADESGGGGRRDRPAPWERMPYRPPGVDHRDDDTTQFATVAGVDGAPVSATRLRRRKHRTRRRALLAGKSLVTMLAVVTFAITATGWAATTWLNANFRDVDALDPNSDSITDAAGQQGDENFLLVGSDTRAGAQQGDDIGDTQLVGGARSDTVMIAHLPADRSRAVIVSFPRDLQIERPQCAVWDPLTGEYTGQIDPGESAVKLNTAYQVGGPKCVTKVVQQLSGLAMNHFMGIDFQGFKGMVDAVGGVQVCVEQPLEDAELGTIIDRPGTSTISGDQALDFVRARTVVGDPTGDYGRITRQQLFLSALLREALSPSVLLSPGKLSGFTNAVAANTFGENIDVTELLELGQSLQGLDAAEVTFVTVPTTGEANDYGNEELRVADTAALFRAIIDGTPLPGERAPRPGSTPNEPSPQAQPEPPSVDETTEPAPLPRPEDVRVRVLNGSGVTGVAGQAGVALQSVGFGVVEVGNAAEQVPGTVVRYAPDQLDDARLLAAAVPGAILEPDPAQIGALQLVLGPEFDGTVLAAPAEPPPGPGQPPAPGPLPEDLATVNGADSACA